jgi:putative copper export protein
MAVLVWIHLVGAALWLGGLATLALAVLVALRTLPRELFRAFVRRAGWAFAILSAGAWLLIGATGLLMAAQLGWPALVRVKTVVASIVLAATILHVLTSRRTTSRLVVATSRTLALLVLAGTLVIFWLGVQAAS